MLNALAEGELRAGNLDVSRVYTILTMPGLGGCEGPKPIHECSSRHEFSAVLANLLSDWDSSAQLVFYFSGHGDVRRGIYSLKLGPTEADYIPFRNILNELEFFGVTRAIVILDTCHSGAAIGKKNTQISLAQETNDLPRGIAIIASSRASEVSEELEDGSASVFTDLLCNGVNGGLDGKPTSDGLISVADIVDYISTKLKSDDTYRNYRQRPVFSVNAHERNIWIARNKSGRIGAGKHGHAVIGVTTRAELDFLFEKTVPTLHPCANAMPDDLDWDLIREYMKRAQPGVEFQKDERLLQRLKLFSPISLYGKPVLHKSAVLCFGLRPEDFYPQAKSLFVLGNQIGEEVKREDVKGPLSVQIQQLHNKTIQALSRVSTFGGGATRNEVYDIEPELIRELISNAIAHRDYESTGYVKVIVETGYIEVQSPGDFPDNLSWDDFISSSKLVSRPVNSALSKYLSDLLVFESMGRGFGIIKRYIEDNGRESIEFTKDLGPTITVRVYRRDTVGGSKIRITRADSENVDELLAPYLQTIRRRSSNLSLGPVDPAGQEYANISLDHLYVGLNGEPTEPIIHQRSDELNTLSFHSSIIGHVFENEKLVLLGDPGSGKSTLLSYMAYCFASALLSPTEKWLEGLNWQITNVTLQKDNYDPREIVQLVSSYRYDGSEYTYGVWEGETPVPIFVQLREFAGSDFDPKSPTALWRFVTTQLENQGLHQSQEALRYKAQKGNVIFLLDGVDEVPPLKRRDVWQSISSMSNGPYGNNRWIATCRGLSYDPSEAPTDAPIQVIRPFDPAQIEMFIDNWYSSLASTGEMQNEKARESAEGLKEAILRPGLRELAQNPLLLTVLVVVQTYYGSLLDNRARLYQAAVETLLLRWQLHKEASGREMPNVLAQLNTSQVDLERFLWKVAWQAQVKQIESGEGSDIVESELIQLARDHFGSYASAEAFVAYTEQRAHLLIGRGGRDERVYSFPHRVFQEYLASCHLASQRRFPKRAAELAVDGEQWREILVLATGTLVHNQRNLEKAIDGIATVLPQAGLDSEDLDDTSASMRTWIAGEMAQVVTAESLEKDEVGKELLPRLRSQLAGLLAGTVVTNSIRCRAGDLLGSLGDPRPGVLTLEPELVDLSTELRNDEQSSRTLANSRLLFSRYPITNGQFQRFIENAGYQDPMYWSEEGQRLKQEETWNAPLFGNNWLLNSPNKPVVGISWYEAEAFANWLTAKTGKYYRLPTVIEWEYAAGIQDGRTYPWGNEWVDGIINSEEANIGTTSAVGCFPQSISKSRLQDMSGNVWEWCQDSGTPEQPSTDQDQALPQNSDKVDVTRMLKGGSAFDGKEAAKCTASSLKPAKHRSTNVGFRLVQVD